MNFTLTFSAEEIHVINQALIKRPFEEVVGLINNIQSQINETLSKEKKDVTP